MDGNNKLDQVIREKRQDEMLKGYFYMSIVLIIGHLVKKGWIYFIHHYSLHFIGTIPYKARLGIIFLTYAFVAPWMVMRDIKRYCKKHQGKISYNNLMLLAIDCKIDCRDPKEMDLNRDSFDDLYQKYHKKAPLGHYWKRLLRTFSEAVFISCLMVLIIALFGLTI